MTWIVVRLWWCHHIQCDDIITTTAITTTTTNTTNTTTNNTTTSTFSITCSTILWYNWNVFNEHSVIFRFCMHRFHKTKNSSRLNSTEVFFFLFLLSFFSLRFGSFVLLFGEKVIQHFFSWRVFICCFLSFLYV